MSDNPFSKVNSERNATRRLAVRIRNLERRFVEAGSGIQFDIDNVGDSLQVETTGFVGTSFSEPASLTFGDDATNYGMAFNAAKGTLFTADPDLNGVDPDTAAVTIEAGATGDAHTQLGLRIVADTSSQSNGEAIGLLIDADGGNTPSRGVGVGVFTTTGTALGFDASIDTLGGQAIGVRGNVNVDGGSANAVAVQGRAHVFGGGTGLTLPFEGLDHNGNPIFQVREDGSVHVKAGASTAMVADL